MTDKRLSEVEAQVAHLTEVTKMHRRLIDMLVKDMVQLKPKRMVCDNSGQLRERSNGTA
jgi:hypothetical protein